ncbi:SDR family oxidoreductase [Martelella limonii]|uniref:SDR family oxidoreductase n=1 Tax=Martelella limonii TaxID=1647649 RepID=UPI0015801BF1|nr:SDR family oxidoreductase [Martelella limonii]
MKDQRIALITGANKGIGLEIARQLGQAGVHVIIGTRNVERGMAALEKLAGAGVAAHHVHLDLDEQDSIAEAARLIGEEHGRLDILVNNAGIFDPHDGPPSKAPAAVARRQLEVNFIGALMVTQAMLPLLRAAPAGRIVNLSSALGSLTLNGDLESPYYSAQYLGYNASKAALNMMTVQLRQELRDTAIVVNSVSPGFVQTDLTGGNGFVTAEEGAVLPVRFALEGKENGGFFDPAGPTPW